MIGCVDVRSYSATDIVLYLLIIGVNHTAVLDLPPPISEQGHQSLVHLQSLSKNNYSPNLRWMWWGIFRY